MNIPCMELCIPVDRKESKKNYGEVEKLSCFVNPMQ